MKEGLLIFLFLIAWGFGEEIPSVELLRSEEFAERQQAVAAITEWAEEEQTKERGELLLKRYVSSQDPEEFYLLSRVLLKIHFQYKKDSIPQKGPGFIGISMMQVPFRGLRQGQIPQGFPDLNKGAFVRDVILGTPAEAAGLQAGDIVTSIDGVSIAADKLEGWIGEEPRRMPNEKLMEIVQDQPPGAKILLGIERGGKALEIEVALMNRLAVPEVQIRGGEEPRIDPAKVQSLLEQDYLRWLHNQRAVEKAK